MILFFAIIALNNSLPISESFETFIAAFLPILNFVWIFTILMMVQWLVRQGLFRIKRKFICWLASTSPKKLFMFKVWFVKRFFRGYLDWYYGCIEKYHGDKVIDALSRAIVKAMAENIKQDNIPEEEEKHYDDE